MLSERTLQGVRREYEKSLPSWANLKRKVTVDSATGTSIGFQDVPGGAFACRVDPIVTEEGNVSQMTTSERKAFIFLSASAPRLDIGDKIHVLTDGQDDVYEISSAQSNRTSMDIDVKYGGVKK